MRPTAYSTSHRCCIRSLNPLLGILSTYTPFTKPPMSTEVSHYHTSCRDGYFPEKVLLLCDPLLVLLGSIPARVPTRQIARDADKVSSAVLCFAGSDSCPPQAIIVRRRAEIEQLLWSAVQHKGSGSHPKHNQPSCARRPLPIASPRFCNSLSASIHVNALREYPSRPCVAAEN